MVTADSYISIDLAGPYKKGEDQLGEGRYMLVGVYTIPVAKDGRPPNLKEEPDRCPADRCRNPGREGYGSAIAGEPQVNPAWGSLPEPWRRGVRICEHLRSRRLRLMALRIAARTLEERDTDLRSRVSLGSMVALDRCQSTGSGLRHGEPAAQTIEGGIFGGEEQHPRPSEEKEPEEGGSEDPLELQVDDSAESPKDETEDGDEKWKALIEREENFVIKQLTFMEILPGRRGASILEGASRIYNRLRYLNLPLRRLHSDRAGELRSKSLRKWALDRGILRTYTGGDDYKTNGRAEAEVNMLNPLSRIFVNLHFALIYVNRKFYVHIYVNWLGT